MNQLERLFKIDLTIELTKYEIIDPNNNPNPHDNDPRITTTIASVITIVK